MKRKLDEIESDLICGVVSPVAENDMDTSLDEILTRPTKRINMYFNTPTHFKDEKKRIVKMSRRKLKAIDKPEADLLRSVLINNTFRRLKMEIRDDRKAAKHSSSGFSNYFTVSKPVAEVTSALLNKVSCDNNNTTTAKNNKYASLSENDRAQNDVSENAVNEHVADQSSCVLIPVTGDTSTQPATEQRTDETNLCCDECDEASRDISIPSSQNQQNSACDHDSSTYDNESSMVARVAQEFDSCVSMDTTESDRDLCEMYTIERDSHLECNVNKATTIVDVNSQVPSTPRSASEVIVRPDPFSPSSQVSSTDNPLHQATHTLYTPDTNPQTTSNPSANTDASLLISNSNDSAASDNSSSLIMDTSLESDNEEIDVCSCNDEQTVSPVQFPPLMRDTSVNTESPIQSVQQSEKHAPHNGRKTHMNSGNGVLNNSCGTTHNEASGDFSNAAVKSGEPRRSEANKVVNGLTGQNDMSDGLASWLAYDRALSQHLYMLGVPHTISDSHAVSCSQTPTTAPFKNSFNKPPATTGILTSSHMQSRHSVAFTPSTTSPPLSHPRTASDYCNSTSSGNGKYSSTTTIASGVGHHLRSSRYLIGAAAIPSLYFSPSAATSVQCHYASERPNVATPFLLQQEQCASTFTQNVSAVDSNTVGGNMGFLADLAASHQGCCENIRGTVSSPFISCNLQRRTNGISGAAPNVCTFQNTAVSQGLNSIYGADMVACT